LIGPVPSFVVLHIFNQARRVDNLHQLEIGAAGLLRGAIVQGYKLMPPHPLEFERDGWQLSNADSKCGVTLRHEKFKVFIETCVE